MSSDVSLNVRILDQIEQLESLRKSWEDLLAEFPYATTFTTLEWLLPWWRAFGQTDKLQVLTFWDASSSLVALAPLALTRYPLSGLSPRVLRLVGDGSSDSDNLDLPVRPGCEEQFAQTLLSQLQNMRERWDFCELNTLPPDSPAAAVLKYTAQRKGWPVFQYSRIASIVPLPATWDAYLEQLSGEDRKNLIRYTRRLEKRYKVRIVRCQEDHEIAPCLDALFHLHQSRWTNAGHPGSFSSSQRRSFYHELTRSLLARRWLEFWLLELDGQIAAAQFAFRYRDTVFQLQEGNDHARASDRVGVVLRGEVMKQLISEGVRFYDFLGGEPGYKARWGAQPRSYIDLKIARPFTFGAAYLRAAHVGGNTKDWLRKNLPESLLSNLQRAKSRLRRP